MPSTTTAIQFASALSREADPRAGAEDIARAVRARLGAQVDLVMVFVTPPHRHALGRISTRLRELLSPRVLLGCTGEGVVGLGEEVELAPAISVLAARLPDVRLTPFRYDQEDWPGVLNSPRALRRSLGVSRRDLRAMVLLADPFSVPMVRLLPALADTYPNVPVVGGMASGGELPRENRMQLNGRSLESGMTGVALSGNLSVRTSVSQGCRAIGRPMVITRARRHLVQELGGVNALQALHDMLASLDDEQRHLAEHSGMLIGRVVDEYKDHFGRGDFLIRGVVGLDRKLGYLAIGDPQVRVGQTIQFHVRDEKTAREDLALVLEGQKLYGSLGGGLLFTCTARGRGLFQQEHTDANLIRDALGDMPLAGVFAAGEIAPVGSRSYVHGHAASLLVFRPREESTRGLS
ncbi:MAG: FIST signal transduction protein [Phycisphaeraceae bacterium]